MGRFWWEPRVTGLCGSGFLEAASCPRLWLCYTGAPRVSLFPGLESAHKSPLYKTLQALPVLPAVQIANAVCAVQVGAFPVGANSYSQV